MPASRQSLQACCHASQNTLRGFLHFGKSTRRCLKKVVFVIDEFQQYAKKGKQQMLYYLLDLLQVTHTPVR